MKLRKTRKVSKSEEDEAGKPKEESVEESEESDDSEEYVSIDPKWRRKFQVKTRQIIANVSDDDDNHEPTSKILKKEIVQGEPAETPKKKELKRKPEARGNLSQKVYKAEGLYCCKSCEVVHRN